MVCGKCGYISKNEYKIFGATLCSICKQFVPTKISDFPNYIYEKIDWNYLDTFRKFNQKPGQKQKQGMKKKAQIGNVVTRPPMGYKISNEKLIQDENASKVHQLFTIFLKEEFSLNQLSKQFKISINGIKKILTNRTYIGEIKFDNMIYKSNHKIIISQEIFYAVKRKLKTYLRPRK
jgi:hypothetical protein